MLSKKYIGVDANNINMIMHYYPNKGYNGETDKDQKVMVYTCGKATEIFERNEVPREYQKMFMVVNNNFSMTFQRIRMHSINLYPETRRLNRFRANELILGTDLFVAYNSRYELSGRQDNSPCSFDFQNCYLYQEEEVENFIMELRQKGLFENYIKSISEMSKVMVSTDEETNIEKGKQYIR